VTAAAQVGSASAWGAPAIREELPDGAILMIPAAVPVIEIDDPDTILFLDSARIVLMPRRRRP
jgi:hypothetical protein